MGLRQELAYRVDRAVQACRARGVLPPATEAGAASAVAAVDLGPPRSADAGDYSTGIALAIARQLHAADRARAFAERIAEQINVAEPVDEAPLIAEATAVGGGYVAIRLRPEALAAVLDEALASGPDYGRSRDAGAGAARALVEFVSANPSGPLTISHGRGGAVGDAIASLLAWTGSDVSREFYVNDAAGSRQVRQLARAALAHYRRLFGRDDHGPMEDPGAEEQAAAIARRIADREGDRFADATTEQVLPEFQALVLQMTREEQQAVLEAFGIRFDTWFSEETLHASGAVERTLTALRDRGHAYEEGGALWLRTTAFGDEADRALVRSDGKKTYLAGDLAYHADKAARGFGTLVDVWSADHAGYVGRTRAGLAALGEDPDRLHIVLTAPVRLLRDGVEVKAGGLSGSAVPLEELLAAAGHDAARFFFLSRPSDVPLDFDLDLAQSAVDANPLHAVMSAVQRLRDVANAGAGAAGSDSDAAEPLGPAEAALVRTVGSFPDVLREAAVALDPERLTRFVRELALQSQVWLEGTQSAGHPSKTQRRVAQGALLTLANALTVLGIAASASA